MSRTDHTNPFLIQVADLKGIKSHGTKLCNLDEVLDYDWRNDYGCAARTGSTNAGRRKLWQRHFTKQRRQRDRALCRAARYDSRTDLRPVLGDRHRVDYELC